MKNWFLVFVVLTVCGCQAHDKLALRPIPDGVSANVTSINHALGSQTGSSSVSTSVRSASVMPEDVRLAKLALERFGRDFSVFLKSAGRDPDKVSDTLWTWRFNYSESNTPNDLIVGVTNDNKIDRLDFELGVPPSNSLEGGGRMEISDFWPYFFGSLRPEKAYFDHLTTKQALAINDLNYKAYVDGHICGHSTSGLPFTVAVKFVSPPGKIEKTVDPVNRYVNHTVVAVSGFRDFGRAIVRRLTVSSVSHPATDNERETYPRMSSRVELPINNWPY